MQMEPPTEKLALEFYQSVDDYVHIASKVGATFPVPTVSLYAYYLFLIINSIVFPAFLLFNEFVLASFVVLVLNIGAVVFIIPRVNVDGFRKYYRHIIGERENRIARVELTGDGVSYFDDESKSFWPWTSITEIEETPDAIFFFYEGNGLAVRKSGFAYLGEQRSFLDSARNLHATAGHQLSE